MVSKITEKACGYHVRTNRRLALYILFLILKTSDCHLFRFSGAEANKSCIFPFQFGDKKYYGCLPWTGQVFIIFMIFRIISFDYYDIQTWCPTEVDKDGIFQGEPIDFYDPWGNCGPDCPTHEETLSWTTDETFKMTVQYGNAVLSSGLKLYGILLVGSFICGLMIILVTATGKITVQPKFSIIYIHINSSNDEF